MPKLSSYFKGLYADKEAEKIAEKEAEPTILKQEAKEERFEEQDDSKIGMRMNLDDKIQSMRNAIAILSPNLTVDGRHTKDNIGAICGFKVTDEMWDTLYESTAD